MVRGVGVWILGCGDTSELAVWLGFLWFGHLSKQWQSSTKYGRIPTVVVCAFDAVLSSSAVLTSHCCSLDAIQLGKSTRLSKKGT
jgi:hypothetical protein